MTLFYARPLGPLSHRRSQRKCKGPLLLEVADVAGKDVAGKSVPAALLMATLQASLHTLATLPTSLPELVRRLNQYACAQNLGGRRFTTAFVAELDRTSRRLTFVNAGHNWPVLRRKNAFFYKILNGEQIGDLFTSLISDRRLRDTNPFDRLGELQKRATELTRKPAEWMPAITLSMLLATKGVCNCIGA